MRKIIEKLDKDLKVLSTEYMEDTVIIDLESKTKAVNCPYCGKRCSSVH